MPLKPDQQETRPYSCVGTCCGRRIDTMLSSNTALPATVSKPVKQPRRNSTEIVVRCGRAGNLPEPFKSHDDGMLQFGVFHPSVMKDVSFKDLVYHPLGKGFNFQGIQFLGENGLGKSQGVRHCLPH